MTKIINTFLPKINFILLVFLVIAVGTIGFDYFKSKKESQELINHVMELANSKSNNKVIIISKDGIFQVLEGKEVSVESLSPLVVEYQNNVFKKDGRFYLYTKGNVIYVFDVYNRYLIGSEKSK
jgi:hypothetical protein